MPVDSLAESHDDACNDLKLAWARHVLQPFDIPPHEQEYLTDLLVRPDSVAQPDLSALCTSSFGSNQLHHAQEIISNIIHHDEHSPRWSESERLASRFICEDLWQRTDRLILLATSHQHQPWLASQALHSPGPWSETDRLIAQAKLLQKEAPVIQQSSFTSPTASHQKLQEADAPSGTAKKRRHRAHNDVSRFFSNDDTEPAKPRDALPPSKRPELMPPANSACLRRSARSNIDVALNKESVPSVKASSIPLRSTKEADHEPSRATVGAITSRGNSKSSHYFDPPSPSASMSRTPSKRPPAGVISAMPFPPLHAPSFGLIQSKVAHEPFWLLVVVTFLIKTKGRDAVPVFWEVKRRFPTPSHLASIENAAELKHMIRHLGLVNNRLRILQKLGRIWDENPPRSGKVYRVRNYDQRDVPPYFSASDVEANAATVDGMLTPSKDDAREDAQAWEIGHLTEGKYALDSWRIFCRDVLLGRANGWNGEGARPEFQPEWCRVRPADKELRAYLRWMWMREGFEWDPVTGDKVPVHPEMVRAVNEGRVEWDDTGSLRIVEQARA